MKLEKNVFIGNVHEKIYGEGKYNVCFTCVFKQFLTKKEKLIFDKIESKNAKLTLEVEEPILDEEERKYLSGVIRPFRHKVKYIQKTEWLVGNNESIYIFLKNSFILGLPPFKKGIMYKNMTLNKEYTLDDLNL